MSKGKNHIKTYTAQDIRRYHSGGMQLVERHAMEKAALEDPFLADAIDGYVHSIDTESELSYLRQQLTSKTERGKVFAFSLRKMGKIAAMLLLVLTASWGIQQLLQDKKETIALHPGKTTTNTRAADDGVAVIEADTTSEVFKNEEVTSPKKTIEKGAPVRSNPFAKTTAPAPVQTDLKKKNDGMVTADVPQVSKEVLLKADTVSLQRALQGNIANLTVRGQVTDQRGAPVPFATVAQPTTRQATLTDINGRFEMALRDTTSPVVSAVGFQTQRLNVQDGAENRVVLQEASGSLQEVVVTGYGQARRRSVAPRSRVETGELEPTVRQSDFDKYIEENVNVPDEVATKNIRGEVRLSFDVSATGEPVNIKVEKSLCPQCDEEAIRLLKEGPKWKIKRGKRGRFNLRF